MHKFAIATVLLFSTSSFVNHEYHIPLATYEKLLRANVVESYPFAIKQATDHCKYFNTFLQALRFFGEATAKSDLFDMPALACLDYRDVAVKQFSEHISYNTDEASFHLAELQQFEYEITQLATKIRAPRTMDFHAHTPIVDVDLTADEFLILIDLGVNELYIPAFTRVTTLMASDKIFALRDAKNIAIALVNKGMVEARELAIKLSDVLAAFNFQSDTDSGLLDPQLYTQEFIAQQKLHAKKYAALYRGEVLASVLKNEPGHRRAQEQALSLLPHLSADLDHKRTVDVMKNLSLALINAHQAEAVVNVKEYAYRLFSEAKFDFVTSELFSALLRHQIDVDSFSVATLAKRHETNDLDVPFTLYADEVALNATEFYEMATSFMSSMNFALSNYAGAMANLCAELVDRRYEPAYQCAKNAAEEMAAMADWLVDVDFGRAREAGLRLIDSLSAAELLDATTTASYRSALVNGQNFIPEARDEANDDEDNDVSSAASSSRTNYLSRFFNYAAITGNTVATKMDALASALIEMNKALAQPIGAPNLHNTMDARWLVQPIEPTHFLTPNWTKTN